MLGGDEVDYFSDDELRGFLKEGLLLDGSAAEKFCERGFSEHLGVEAAASDMRVSYEQLVDDPAANGEVGGRRIALINGAFALRRLSVKDDRVRVLSHIMAEPWFLCPDPEPLSPGATFFKNALGGRVGVFAASLVKAGTFGDGQYNFISGTRKKQLAHLLGLLADAPLPAVVEADVDLYVRCGEISPERGGGMLLCIFNLNPDTLPQLRLRLADTAISDIHLLDDAGQWAGLDWRLTDTGDVAVDTPVEPMTPLVVRILRQGST